MVLAQKLILVHSSRGNLCSLVEDFFYHNGKVESFVTMAHQIGFKPNKIVCITNNQQDGQDASKAGLKVILVGCGKPMFKNLHHADTFDEIFFKM